MTDSQRAAILEAIKRQKMASGASKEAARESLMKSGLYNADGSLRAAYGGKRKSAA
jgi:hypothetical protein